MGHLDGVSRRWDGVPWKPTRPASAVVGVIQRSRIVAAALDEASACGYQRTSVAAIVGRAGVSRKTFYEFYESREDCYREAFEASMAQLAGLLAPVCEDTGQRWEARVRAGLQVCLEFLEVDRSVATFLLDYVIQGKARETNAGAKLLEDLRRAVDEGSLQARLRHKPSPLTAEGLVGGALAIIGTRLEEPRDLIGLLNPLMGVIVLPYRGPAAADRELQRSSPKPRVSSERSARSPLEGLDMRVTYRTARTLAAIAEGPGRSNSEVAAEVEVGDPGQISKLLARLEDLGLIENSGLGHAHGAANAWRLTPRGKRVDAAIRQRFAPAWAAGRGR